MAVAAPRVVLSSEPADPASDQAGPRPAAAIVDFGQSPLGKLVEERLRERPCAVWVEKEEAVRRVERDPRFERVMEPWAGRHRVAWGRRLNVDLIVFLRHPLAGSGVVRVVVCETKHGVRLASEELPRLETDEMTMPLLIHAVEKAIGRYGKRPLTLWTVSPVANADRPNRHDYLEEAYAAIARSVLASQPGTVVIDPAEAESISPPPDGAGTPFRWPPWRVTGAFRHWGDEGSRVQIRWKLRRGDEVLREVAEDHLSRGEAAGYLRRTAAAFYEAATGRLTDHQAMDLIYDLAVELRGAPDLSYRVARYVQGGKSAKHLDRAGRPEVIARLEDSPDLDLRIAGQTLRRMATFHGRDSTSQAGQLGRLAGEMLRRMATSSEPKQQAAGSPGKESRATSAAARFDRVRFIVDGETERTRLGDFRGCVPAGPGVDAFWNYRELCLMKEKDRAISVLSEHGRDRGIKSPVYDGRYLWVPVGGDKAPPELVVIDPQDLRTWRITEKDGLPAIPLDANPPHVQNLRVAPVSPGCVCAAGWVGRSWVASVKLDPDDPRRATVNVIQEARRVPDTVNLRTAWDVETAFHLHGMVRLSEKPPEAPGAESRIVVFRGRMAGGIRDTGKYPMLVDPGDWTVEIPRQPLPRKFDPEVPALVPREYGVRGGSVYFISTAGSRYDVTRHLYRYGMPEFRPVPVTADPPEGEIICDDRIHLVGEKWWRYDEQADRWEDLGRVPWTYRPRYGDPNSLYRSSHYGLLARTGPSTFYAVSFSAKESATGSDEAESR